jgi:hypothetical protein
VVGLRRRKGNWKRRREFGYNRGLSRSADQTRLVKSEGAWLDVRPIYPEDLEFGGHWLFERYLDGAESILYILVTH